MYPAPLDRTSARHGEAHELHSSCPPPRARASTVVCSARVIRAGVAGALAAADHRAGIAARRARRTSHRRGPRGGNGDTGGAVARKVCRSHSRWLRRHQRASKGDGRTVRGDRAGTERSDDACRRRTGRRAGGAPAAGDGASRAFSSRTVGAGTPNRMDRGRRGCGATSRHRPEREPQHRAGAVTRIEGGAESIRLGGIANTRGRGCFRLG